jgi:tyrosinase
MSRKKTKPLIMSNLVRKNAWDANNGGQFQDQSGQYTELYWYAKAVQTMQSRPISNPTSWWFYAAIHGEYLLHPINI